MATGEDTVRRESFWSACVTWRDGAVCQLRRKEPVERERKYPAASFWSGCPREEVPWLRAWGWGGGGGGWKVKVHLHLEMWSRALVSSRKP